MGCFIVWLGRRARLSDGEVDPVVDCVGWSGLLDTFSEYVLESCLHGVFLAYVNWLKR